MSPGIPTFSIILTTYNRLKHAQQAIESVLAQSWKDWELLVIDDGSTDGTAAWLSQLQDHRIRLYLHSHSGAVSASRNFGIARSRGEWVAFLDDDDAWHPKKLARQRELHQSHPEWRWSYTAVMRIDESGARMAPNPNIPWHPLSGRIVLQLLNLEASVALPSVVVHRELLKQVDGFDETLYFSEDYDLWFRLARLAEAGVVDEELTLVRSHKGNRTAHEPRVNIAFMKSYEKFSLEASPTERKVCRRRRAYHAVRLARQWLSIGNRRQAYQALFTAFKLRPHYPWAWRTLGKAVLQSWPRRANRVFDENLHRFAF